MANIFDQFDGPTVDNPFDQFDSSTESAAPPQAPPASLSGYGRQIFSGLLEGATGALGAPVDLVNSFIVNPAVKGINYTFGTNLQPSAEPIGGSAGLRRGLAISPSSDNSGEQFSRRVAQSVGGALVPLSATARSFAELGAGLASAAGGGIGGATAQQVLPGNVGAEMAADLIGGLGTGATIAGVADRTARRAAERAVPTVDDLKTQAGNMYDLAERQGVTASQQQTQTLAQDFRQLARQEGLISPTGRVSDAYPRAAEALRMMDDYGTGAMTPVQMQTVRDVLSDAVNATKGKERRIASMMLDRFDSFTAPLAPSLAQARGLYSRAMRGEQLETLRELAEANRSRFGASGVENALRNEYRALDRRVVKGQERGWSPAEAAAISRVNRGTFLTNALRNAGKLAPTGVVSLGVGGGVPFAVGNTVGGPVVGSALSAATMGTGFLARDAATRLGMRNAERAELIARNGGPLATSATDALKRRIFEAIMGSQLAAQ